MIIFNIFSINVNSNIKVEAFLKGKILNNNEERDER